MSLALDEDRLLVDGREYRIHGYRQWYGNMAWDAFRLKLADAARLLEYLRTQHWTCTMAETGVFEAWGEGGPLAPRMLRVMLLDAERGERGQK